MNNLLDILGKIRRYGIAGIKNHILATIRYRRNRKFFLKHSNHRETPQFGLTIVGDLSQSEGLSKTLRDLAYALKEAKIPFQTFDTHPNPNFPREDIAPILTPRSDFRTRKYECELEMLDSPFPDCNGVRQTRLAFWEATSGFAAAFPALAYSQEIVGMSDFNVSCFKEELGNTVQVRKILYPFRGVSGQIAPRDTIRDKYGIRKKDFVVLFNFDMNSSIERKNPYAVLAAFSKAFKGDASAHLLFKTMHAKQNAETVAKLLSTAEQLGIATQFTHIAEYLPHSELYGLTNACDAYISLHRGEGFGLGIAEAMSLGKPVIVTDYSATTEFCNSYNSIPISYRMIPLTPKQREFPTFGGIKEWAEPNVDEAADALRRLRDDPKFAAQLGERAATSIKEQFSIANFRKSIDSFLNAQSFR